MWSHQSPKENWYTIGIVLHARTMMRCQYMSLSSESPQSNEEDKKPMEIRVNIEESEK